MGCVHSSDVQIKPEQITSTTIVVHQPIIEPKLKAHQSSHPSFPISHDPSPHIKPTLPLNEIASDSDYATSEDDDIEDLSVCEQPKRTAISRSQSSQRAQPIQARQSSSVTSERYPTNNRAAYQQHNVLHRSSISMSPASPSSQRANVSSSLTPPINESSTLAFPPHIHRASLTASNLSTKRLHVQNTSSVPQSMINKRPSLSTHRHELAVPASPSRSLNTLTAPQEQEIERDPTMLTLGSMPTTPRSIERHIDSPSVSRITEGSTPSVTQLRLQRHGSKYRVVDIDALPESVYYSPVNHTPHLSGTPAVAASSFTSVEMIDNSATHSRQGTSIISMPEHQSSVPTSNGAASSKLSTDITPTASAYQSRIRPGHKHAASFDGRALDWHVTSESVPRRSALHQRTFSVSHMQRSVDALAAAGLVQSAAVATFPASTEVGPSDSPAIPPVHVHSLGSRKSSRRFTKSRHSNHLFDNAELSVRVHSADKSKSPYDEPTTPTRLAPALPDEPTSAKSTTVSGQGQEHGSLVTHSRKRSMSSVVRPPHSSKHFDSSNGADSSPHASALSTGRVPRGALLLFSTPMATQLAGIAVHKLGLTSDICVSATDALNKLRERPPTVCLVDLAVKSSKQVLQSIVNLNTDISSPASPSSSSAGVTSSIVAVAIVSDLSDSTIQEAIHLGCSGCIE